MKTGAEKLDPRTTDIFKMQYARRERARKRQERSKVGPVRWAANSLKRRLGRPRAILLAIAIAMLAIAASMPAAHAGEKHKTKHQSGKLNYYMMMGVGGQEMLDLAPGKCKYGFKSPNGMPMHAAMFAGPQIFLIGCWSRIPATGGFLVIVPGLIGWTEMPAAEFAETYK